MKRIFLIVLTLALIFTSESEAQETKQVKIFLNNGVKISGAIVDSFNENVIRILINNQTEPVQLKYDYIRKIKFKGNGFINDEFSEKIKYMPGLEIKQFYHDLKLGALFGDEYVNVSAQTINGYQFNQFLGAGVGAGVNNFENYTTLPLYASLKGYIMDKKVSPFYYGDIGYGFAWGRNTNSDYYRLDNVQGGLYWQIGIGYQINFYQSAMVFSIGYMNQKVSGDYTYENWGLSDLEISEDRILRPITFSVGFSF